MITDCHGHYTTEPLAMHKFCKRQIEAFEARASLPSPASLTISDDLLRGGSIRA
jgi:4-oxalmesaconate hydratase